MTGLLPDVDPDGLLEYSVVFNDRSLNHMSKKFQGVVNDISRLLKSVYAAETVVLVPGGGTYGMEAVARQFATDQRCLVVRNGWFSYRWTQIFDKGAIPASASVLKARPVESGHHPGFAPAPVEEVVAAIRSEKPDLVFAPHVETSAGMMLPTEYVKEVSSAVHAHGGLMVLDCVASGAMWVDMLDCGVDVLISAPQKGWTASPCAGLVMLSAAASERMKATESTSFACDLKKWHEIMQAYENGGHAYHATLPTDALTVFRDAMQNTESEGFDRVRQAQFDLGVQVRGLLAERGFKSLAAPGFEAPSVVVCYTDDPSIQNGSRFAANGVQVAAGVPLQCDEPADFMTFRIGLFGLDKLQNIDRTVAQLKEALDAVV